MRGTTLTIGALIAIFVALDGYLRLGTKITIPSMSNGGAILVGFK